MMAISTDGFKRRQNNFMVVRGLSMAISHDVWKESPGMEVSLDTTFWGEQVLSSPPACVTSQDPARLFLCS